MDRILDFILDLLSKEIGPYLNSLWGNLVFLRITNLILIILIVLALIYRKKLLVFLQRDKNTEHDLKIFQTANIMLTERNLLDFLDQLGADHSYYRNPRIHISRYCNFFEEIGNGYLDQTIEKKNKELLSELNDLLNFIGITFFSCPGIQDTNDPRYCMYPDLNIDRGGRDDSEASKIYRSSELELNNHIEKVKDAYNGFRRTIKNKLKI